MSKIEMDNQEARQELKKEIMSEIKHDARRKKIVNCLGCLSLELLVLAIPILFVATMLAKTGLVEIPVMTNWLYRHNEPSRLVVPLAGSNTTEILIAAATRAKIDRNFGILKIGLSESELTTIAQEGLEVAGDALPLPLSSVQIAADDDVVELYVTSPRNGREVAIRARIIPTVEEGQIKIAVQELRIGALDIPAGVSKMLVPLLNSSIGETLSDSVSQIGRLVGLEVEKGIIRFHIVPKNISL